MIESISKNVLYYLISNGVIEDKEDIRNYYKYGIEITISSIINIVIIIILSTAFKSTKEGFLFLSCFVPLRQFTGGYHAKSYFQCNLTFAISFAILLAIYHLTWRYLTVYGSIVITVLVPILFFSECPVENAHKKLSSEKKKRNKLLSVFFGILYGIIGTSMIYFSKGNGAILLYTLVLIAFLVIIATLQDLRKEGE